MTPAAGVLAACLVLVVLSVWVPVAAARRWVPSPWRPFAASVAAAVGLAVTGWLTVQSISALTL